MPTTKKKTTTKRKRKKRSDADPTKGLLRLRGNLKLQYAAAVYSTQAANAKLEAQRSEIKRRAETDEVFADALRLMSLEKSLQEDLSKSLGKLRSVAHKICKKFDIPFEEFREYVVDTETGKVTHSLDEVTETL